MTDKIKHFIQVLQDAECLSDTPESICLDGFELGYLYATNREFKEFFNECVVLYESYLNQIKSGSSTEIDMAIGDYLVNRIQSNIEQRFAEFNKEIKP